VVCDLSKIAGAIFKIQRVSKENESEPRQTHVSVGEGSIKHQRRRHWVLDFHRCGYSELLSPLLQFLRPLDNRDGVLL
jgi:hypothetical protein